MTHRRWIADHVEGDRAILRGQNAHHLARVLRAKVGQEFAIVCGETACGETPGGRTAGGGTVRLGRIQTITDGQVVFTLGETITQTESRPITLLLAVFKFDRMEWAIEKATELGVTAIQPVISRRTDAHLAAAAGKRAGRWRRIVHEAAQQSRRISVPEVAEPLKLKDALDPHGVFKILLAETGVDLPLAEALAKSGSGPIALAVGPEGGWAVDEFEQFHAAGWTAASLGPTILRAETAAIAGLAVVGAIAAFPQK